MKSSEYVSLLATSLPGIGSAVAALATGVAVGVFVGPLAGVLSAVGGMAILSTVLTVSGIGPRAAEAEQSRRRWTDVRTRLEAVKDARNRLASMRIRDESIQSLTRLVATRGEAYLSACHAVRSHDPVADDAIAAALEAADAFVRELDDAATERRHGLTDTDPFTDARARTARLLDTHATIVRESTTALRGGLTPADTVGIQESL